MIKLTLYVPTRDNPRANAHHMPNGWRPSDHVRATREALRAAGFDGWTEVDSRGVWRDDVESTRQFVILTDDPEAGAKLAKLAHTVLADQDSVLITTESVMAVFVTPHPEPVPGIVADFNGAPEHVSYGAL